MLDGGGPLQLREIAAGAAMAPSNVHRYLASFVSVGMAVQDPATGRYDLGPLAIRLGLAALGRIDGIEVMAAGLSHLVETAGVDAHTTIWGNAGAVVLRWRGQQAGQIGVRVMEGTVLPVLSSATGRVWAAHLPAPLVQPFVARELSAIARAERAPLRRAFESKLEAVRESGYSYSSGERRVGIDAVCAPVFGSDGRIAFALTVVGPTTNFAARPGLPGLRQLLSAAAELSRRLGARSA
jgi:DNA-binding IclR family transcriptional regulator